MGRLMHKIEIHLLTKLKHFSHFTPIKSGKLEHFDRKPCFNNAMQIERKWPCIYEAKRIEWIHRSQQIEMEIRSICNIVLFVWSTTFGYRCIFQSIYSKTKAQHKYQMNYFICISFWIPLYLMNFQHQTLKSKGKVLRNSPLFAFPIVSPSFVFNTAVLAYCKSVD